MIEPKQRAVTCVATWKQSMHSYLLGKEKEIHWSRYQTATSLFELYCACQSTGSHCNLSDGLITKCSYLTMRIQPGLRKLFWNERDGSGRIKLWYMLSEWVLVIESDLADCCLGIEAGSRSTR